MNTRQLQEGPERWGGGGVVFPLSLPKFSLNLTLRVYIQMLSSNLNPTLIFYCFLPMNHSSGAWISISQSKTGIFTPSGTSHTFGTLQRLNFVFANSRIRFRDGKFRRIRLVRITASLCVVLI